MKCVVMTRDNWHPSVQVKLFWNVGLLNVIFHRNTMTSVKFTWRNFFFKILNFLVALHVWKNGKRVESKEKKGGKKANLIAQFFLDILSHLWYCIKNYSLELMRIKRKGKTSKLATKLNIYLPQSFNVKHTLNSWFVHLSVESKRNRLLSGNLKELSYLGSNYIYN